MIRGRLLRDVVLTDAEVRALAERCSVPEVRAGEAECHG